MHVRAVAVLMIITLTCLGAQAQDVAESVSSEQGRALLERLQSLDQDLQRHLRRAQIAREAQRALPEELSDTARQSRSTLGKLWRLVGTLPANEPDLLLAKLGQLQLLTGNLERAAATGDTTPALSAAARGEGRVRTTMHAGQAVPGNDTCSAATPVSDGSRVGSTAEAGNDGHAGCGASYSSPDVWFSYSAVGSGWIGANTFGSDYDTVLSVHAACPGTLSNSIGCNDDTYGLQSAVGFLAAAGQEYLIRVSGFDGAAGTFVLSVGPAAAITGTVGHSGGMRPIEGATVVVFNQTGSFAGAAITDRAGFYRVDGLYEGSYVAGAENHGDRVGMLYDGILCPGGPVNGCDPSAGTPIATSLGTTTGDIDFGLPPGGTISGTVRDAGTGTPLVGAKVTVFDVGGNPVSSGISNVAGLYSAGGLPTGSYTVVATDAVHAGQLYNGLPCPAGYDPTAGDAVPVTVGGTTTGIDFSLARIGSISGRISEAGTGDPVDGGVDVWTSTGTYLKAADTNSTGSYVVGGLDTGSYLVIARSLLHVDELYDGVACEQGCDLAAATPIAVVDGATTSGIDFTLAHMGEISGQVSESATGLPIPSLTVSVYDSNGEEVDYSYTKSDGSYTVPVLRTGYYTAIASHWYLVSYVDELYDDLPCDPYCDPQDGTLIPVSSGAATSGIDFALDSLGHIEGTVSDAVTGEPIPDVRVEIWRSYAVQWLFTDELGRYHSQPLWRGDYLVVTNNTDPYIDMLYEGVACPGGPWIGCSQGSGTPVQVDNGIITTGIDLALEPTSSSISGVVINAASGAPEPAWVRIYDQAGVRVSEVGTDANGLYTAYGLAPGAYFVVADALFLVDEVYDDIPCPRCDPTIGTPVMVEADAMTRHVDFALEQGGAISGTISDDGTGEPLAGRVVVWTGAGDRWTYLTAGSDGGYLIDKLPPGSYRLSFDMSYSPYLAEVYDDVPCPQGVFSCDLGPGTPIEVTAGATTAGIDVALSYRGSGLIGSVRDSSGQAIPGVYLDVWDAGTGLLATTAVTGLKGTCVAVVSAGTYHVSTHNTLGYYDQVYESRCCPYGSVFSGACEITGGEQVVVLAEQLTGGIDLVLGTPIFSNGFESADTSAWSAAVGAVAGSDVSQDEGLITGTVTERTSGDPLVGVPVRIYDSLGDLVDLAYTDADGSYASFVLDPGIYTAVAGGGPCPDKGCAWVGRVYDDTACSPFCLWLDGTPIQVLAGEITEGIDFALDRRGAIAGTVTESATGEPIANLRVEIRRYGASVWEPVAYQRTDLSGQYMINGLEPGDYYVLTNQQGGGSLIDEIYQDVPCLRSPYGSMCPVSAGTPVPVQLNTTIGGIDLDLDEGGVLTGTISDAATGQPIHAASISVYDAAGRLVTSSIRSDSSGNWQADELGTGTYFAVARHTGYVTSLYDGLPCTEPGLYSCDYSAGTPIQVSNAETTVGIDFSLQRAGTISGVVRDADTGQPIPGARVTLYYDNGEQATYLGTEVSGFYTKSMYPGTYFAIAYSDRHSYQLFDGLPGCQGCDVTTGTLIVVEPGTNTRSVDFDLEPLQAGAVVGTVSDDRTGNPLNPIYLQVWDDSGTEVGHAWTEQGSYRVTDLEPGTYYVGVTGSTSSYLGYLAELYDDLPMEEIEDPTKGTPVVITDDSTAHVDFALRFMHSGIVATVHHSVSGEPLAGVLIDVWDAATGELVTTAATGSGGATLAALPAGTYYLSTDNGSGFLDQVFDGISCPDGPAFSGACDPSAGSIVVVNDEQVSEGISFLLGPAVIFRDSFDSGDTAAWSSTVQ